MYGVKKFFNDRNINSALLFVLLGERIDSDARSGCGINPITFPLLLQTAAIISVDPLGF